MCSGYYKYENGYTPDFPGLSDYEGRLVHPQKWPEDLDYKNKRVLVIGSGATAVTLIPSMAEETAHITMLQRSPDIHVRDAVEKLSWRLSFRRFYRKAGSIV